MLYFSLLNATVKKLGKSFIYLAKGEVLEQEKKPLSNRIIERENWR